LNSARRRIVVAVFLEVFSAVLAVVALIVAYVHTKDLRENTSKLGSVTTGLEGVTKNLEGITQENAAMSQELNKVATALPTRDIGEFPAYVDELADMIKEAKHTVIVVCDVPCYCAFSDRKLWAKYWGALYEAKERFFGSELAFMSLTWMDPQCRKEVLAEQFDPQNEEWKIGIEERLAAFLKAEQSTETAETVTYRKFEEIVEDAHERAIKDIRLPFTPVHRSLHLYFWILDDEAVFAIPNYANRSKGRAIRTRDANVIGGLRAIHNRLQKDQRSGNSHVAA
jgi:uncharacterized protein YoxC